MPLTRRLRRRVVAVLPVRITAGSLRAARERSAIANGRRRAEPRNADQRAARPAEQRRKGERHQAAQRRAHDRAQPLDAEARAASKPRARDVLERELRKVEPIAARRWPGRSTRARWSRSSCPANSRTSRSSGRCRCGAPGPIIASHQPGLGSCGGRRPRAPSGDRPVKIRIALSRAAFSRPQVS